MHESAPDPLAAAERNISVEAARRAIHAAIRPIHGSETVALAKICGRVLAGDLISPIDVPAHDNSAMDGYAFDGAALRPDADLSLRFVASVMAGQKAAGHVGMGECVRIMTGAALPGGTDTVVPLELIRFDGERVLVPAGTIQGRENVRRQGEDLGIGKPALFQGRILRPADVGLIASLGMTEAEVMRRVRVAVFSTGDEITPPGRPLPANAIYDSNRFALLAAIERLGLEPIDLGLVRDDPKALEATLREAAEKADVVLTSGGVSAGDADFVREVLSRSGSVTFWTVAMRPGRPFAFGDLHAPGGRSAWLFALPGNPVAALVGFYVFAREALQLLAGAQPEPLPALRARSVTAIRKRPGRTEFQRAHLGRGADGQCEVRAAGSQGAGILRSMSEANALIVLGHDQGAVAAGEFVDVWAFDGLV
jgi:molybdopterin molybdotransferase